MSQPHPFTWKAEPTWQRVIRCIRMLAVHGIITERERDKALARATKKFRLQRTEPVEEGVTP